MHIAVFACNLVTVNGACLYSIHMYLLVHKVNVSGWIFQIGFVFVPSAMLSGSLITTSWCVLRLLMEKKSSRYG
jgi:hypothetical protein